MERLYFRLPFLQYTSQASALFFFRRMDFPLGSLGKQTYEQRQWFLTFFATVLRIPIKD